MHRVEQVEGPLDGLAAGGLAAGIQADGDHGRRAHDLHGHRNRADLPCEAADHPADDENTDGLQDFAPLPGHSEANHEHHAQSAVIRAQGLGNDGAAEKDQGPKPGEFFHALDGDEAQQQRDHDAGVAQGNAAEEQQLKGNFRQQRADGQPGAIPPGIAGMGRALRQQEAVDGKGDPSHYPQPQHCGQKGRADVVDEHGGAGDQLQSLLGKAVFFVHGNSSFP